MTLSIMAVETRKLLLKPERVNVFSFSLQEQLYGGIHTTDNTTARGWQESVLDWFQILVH
eukprot:scaffold543_cov119-Cylindrotheca_fusiformis.AAC.9